MLSMLIERFHAPNIQTFDKVTRLDGRPMNSGATSRIFMRCDKGIGRWEVEKMHYPSYVKHLPFKLTSINEARIFAFTENPMFFRFASDYI